MENFVHYISLTAIALAAFYGIYWLLLRDQVMFSLNRWIILTFIGLAFVLPFLKVEPELLVQTVSVETLKPLKAIAKITQTEANKEGFPMSRNIVVNLYIVGVFLLGIRFIYGLARLLWLYLRSPTCTSGGFRVVLLRQKQSPFTFFHLLFMHEEDFHKGERSALFVHEKVHRDHLHSLDLLLLEIMTILQWFNPFMWMFKKALSFEHEFLADKKVLEEGFDRFGYQKLLFERNTGITVDLANNFNYSPLKRRLKMMNSAKNVSVAAQLKYVLSFPLAMGIAVMMILSTTSFAQDKVYSEVDEFPEYPGGKSEMYKFVGANIKYPKVAREIGVEARVYVSFVVNAKGDVQQVTALENKLYKKTENEVVVVGYDKSSAEHTEGTHEAIKAINAEALRVVKALKSFSPGKKDGKAVNTKIVLPINFKLSKPAKK